MNKKFLLSLAATSVLALGLAGVRAEDAMPMGKPGAPMPDMAKLDAPKPDADKDKMSMADMMKACNERSKSCDNHLDEALAAAEAKNFEEVKKHLALAKKDMAGCMLVMDKMDKIDKPMNGMDKMGKPMPGDTVDAPEADERQVDCRANPARTGRIRSAGRATQSPVLSIFIQA